MLPKDAALHTLGRTIVNFQRLELLLKHLAQFAPVEGPIHTIDMQLKTRKEKADRFTLGAAITAWLDVLDGKVGKPVTTNDIFAITMKSRVCFNIDAALQEAHAAGLKALLEERNSIIHGELAQFPWDSDVDCRELATYLENLNEAIKQHMDFLEPIVAALTRVNSGTATVEPGEHPRHYVAHLIPKV
jgi:hypothetical protein